jgi:D-arabinose 1-dehydrogenase-like Zn-dependent alcohol dehydrogenase
VLSVPEKLDPAAAAPLLCGGHHYLFTVKALERWSR